MSALLKVKCCCDVGPGWYTCKPVYCADAFVNEGFPSIQEDAQFMTFLNQSVINSLEEEGFFPYGDAVYWHDGVQLWVLDDSSDYLGDAFSPEFLEPPIFAPDRFTVSFGGARYRQPPPPLFSFVVEEDPEQNNDQRFITVTHLGVLLFSRNAINQTFAGFTVNMDPTIGPDPDATGTTYGYQKWYRPTYNMANNLPTVRSKGLPIDMSQVLYVQDEETRQVFNCLEERQSGECEAPVFLIGGGNLYSMNFGPSTVEGVYGTTSNYIHPRQGLSLNMVVTESVSLEQQCDGTVNALGPPYFFSFGQNEVPNDQGVLQGLVYQGDLSLACPTPNFPPFTPFDTCDPDTVFLTFGTDGFGNRARLKDPNPANQAMEISAGLCSMFTQFPSADSYVKRFGGREYPNPIDGLGIFFKGAGRSELASDFRVPELGIDEGEENFLSGGGNGFTIFQPVSIQ
jgi:hypothetical protein